MNEYVPSPSSASAGSETRTAPRIRSFLRGEVSHSNGAQRAECVIRDISDSGARVQISSAINLPEHFELFIPQRNRREKARLVWRTGEEIGVVFPARIPAAGHSAPQAAGAANDDMAQRVKTLEGEIAELRKQLATMRAMVETVFKDRA